MWVCVWWWWGGGVLGGERAWGRFCPRPLSMEVLQWLTFQRNFRSWLCLPQPETSQSVWSLSPGHYHSWCTGSIPMPSHAVLSLSAAPHPHWKKLERKTLTNVILKSDSDAQFLDFTVHIDSYWETVHPGTTGQPMGQGYKLPTTVPPLPLPYKKELMLIFYLILSNLPHIAWNSQATKVCNNWTRILLLCIMSQQRNR